MGLVREIPDLNTIETNLVQGRWHDNLVPRLENYELDPLNLNKELMKAAEIAPSRAPGFSMKADTKTSGPLDEDQISKVFGVISNIQSLGIIEKRLESITRVSHTAASTVNISCHIIDIWVSA